MFDWNILNFLWILVAALVAGFGWAVGVKVAARLGF